MKPIESMLFFVFVRLWATGLWSRRKESSWNWAKVPHQQQPRHNTSLHGNPPSTQRRRRRRTERPTCVHFPTQSPQQHHHQWVRHEKISNLIISVGVFVWVCVAQKRTHALVRLWQKKWIWPFLLFLPQVMLVNSCKNSEQQAKSVVVVVIEYTVLCTSNAPAGFVEAKRQGFE